jgi:hypothetical protein
MTTLFPDRSLSDLNQLFLIIVLILIPLLTWAVWDLEQRRNNWLSRRQGKEPQGRMACAPGSSVRQRVARRLIALFIRH